MIYSATLTSALVSTDRSQINDLTNQWLTWFKANMVTNGTPFTIIFDNIATISTTIGRCVVFKFGDSTHAFQINASSNTQVGCVTTTLASINTNTWPVTSGPTGSPILYVLQNLSVRMMASIKTVLFRFAIDGINSEPWQAYPLSDGLWSVGQNYSFFLTRSNDTYYVVNVPTYGAVVNGSGQNPLIPELLSLGGIIQPAQPSNVFGVTITGSYQFLTDSLGNNYYFHTVVIIKEIL